MSSNIFLCNERLKISMSVIKGALIFCNSKKAKPRSLPAEGFAEDDEDRPRPQGRLGKGHDQHAEAAAQREGDHHASDTPELRTSDCYIK
jgi:hypothetical protein